MIAEDVKKVFEENTWFIATCGDGLYAKSMGGGSVNPVTGEFNFGVREGYLIRDGKVAEPVRGAMLVGNGTWNGKGVFNMEQFDPEPFMKLLPEYGLPWTEEFLD